MAFTSWQARPWHLRVGAIAALLFLAGFGWFVVDLTAGIPNKSELRAFSNMASANILFDAPIGKFLPSPKSTGLRCRLPRFPRNLIKAVIAIEDRRFFDHEGFDPIRIVGSAIAVVRAGEAVQGGSTITQQLARQSVGREKTLRRKLREMLFAAQLEHNFTKNEILELYLNKVYFGDGLYGAEAASRGYFGQEGLRAVARRSRAARGIAERRRRATIPPPRRRKAEARQTVVLKAMLQSKAISRQEYDTGLQDADRDLRRPALRRTVRPVLQGRSAAPARRAVRPASVSTRAG
jgi:penicillin-binding protein 1A